MFSVFPGLFSALSFMSVIVWRERKDGEVGGDDPCISGAQRSSWFPWPWLLHFTVCRWIKRRSLGMCMRLWDLLSHQDCCLLIPCCCSIGCSKPKLEGAITEAEKKEVWMMESLGGKTLKGLRVPEYHWMHGSRRQWQWGQRSEHWWTLLEQIWLQLSVRPLVLLHFKTSWIAWRRVLRAGYVLLSLFMSLCSIMDLRSHSHFIARRKW